MEFQCGIFLAETEDNLTTPTVHAEGHVRKKVRIAVIGQRRDLLCQRLFQSDTSGCVFVIALREFMRSVAGKGAGAMNDTYKVCELICISL